MKTFRYTTVYIVLATLLVVLFLCNIIAGSAGLTVGEVLSAFTGGADEAVSAIVLDIRLPRALAALILGGILAVSGFLLQTFFDNPIAGPYVLGISSGAKLMVAIAMITALSRGIYMNSFFMILAAFIGSLLTMAIVLLVSLRVKNMALLVVCGVMIGYICSAITEFMVTFADDSNIVNLHNWSLGSFSGINDDNVKVMAVIAGIALIATLFLSKPIGAYQAGELYAKNVGVNVKLLRFLLIIFSSLMSAVVTAFAGPVSFVGIAVPHIVKRLLKTVNPFVMITACFLGGAVFCLFSDLFARLVFAPTEVSISSVTSVFGAPVVLFVMLERRRSYE
ncbi:MAG: iron ABC transporter permease [Lachnospiraceae bacterium]|nr:iron ABC transporter permease [Lachnospiraceae bacterium]